MSEAEGSDHDGVDGSQEEGLDEQINNNLDRLNKGGRDGYDAPHVGFEKA